MEASPARFPFHCTCSRIQGVIKMKTSKLYPDGFVPDLVMLAIIVIYTLVKHRGDQYGITEACIISAIFLTASFITAVVQRWRRDRMQINDAAVHTKVTGAGSGLVRR
jgi:hypothetical protein